MKLRVLQTRLHAPIDPRSPGRSPSFLPQSEGHRPGDPRFAAATHPSQAETATSAVESVGSAVLDYPALHLVPMGRGPGSSETGDRRQLAPGGISALLEVAITSTRWQTESYC